jgi:hypothetical protein
MPEQQNIEYKFSWHDEYLKWICHVFHISIFFINMTKIIVLKNNKCYLCYFE